MIRILNCNSSNNCRWKVSSLLSLHKSLSNFSFVNKALSRLVLCVFITWITLFYSLCKSFHLIVWPHNSLQSFMLMPYFIEIFKTLPAMPSHSLVLKLWEVSNRSCFGMSLDLLVLKLWEIPFHYYNDQLLRIWVLRIWIQVNLHFMIIPKHTHTI